MAAVASQVVLRGWPVPMRRLNAARRSYQILVTAKRTLRGLTSKDKAHERRVFRTGQLPRDGIKRQRIGSPRRRPKSAARLVAPETFGLLEKRSRRNLLAFLRTLRQATLGHGRKVWIDFSHTRKMHPDGTLLFAAELDRINRAVTPRTLVRCSYPADIVVEQVLQHLGLLDMMRRPSRTTITADNVRYWRVDSDTVVDGSHAESVIAAYEHLFTGGEEKKLYNGLTEAMTNCRHHAYTQERHDNAKVKADPRWWMFSQQKDGSLYVAICDLGIGINRSLLEGKKWPVRQVLNAVNAVGLGLKDASFIKAAMALGKSRTNLSHRGNGLRELKSVIESIRAGWLLILSNRGMYQYRGAESLEVCADFRGSIFGTLIAWRIPIPEGERDDF